MPLHFLSRVILVLALSAHSLTTGVVLGADNSSDRLAKVDELFQEIDRPDVPGCAVGIVRDGKLIYSKGFGSANLDYEVPNTPTTIFEIASASKAFTSACIALLMDQGKIDPDDDVRKFLPELHAFEHPVRIRHMLRCETGIWAQFHIMPLAGWDNVPIHTAYSKADLLAVLSGQKRLPFEPGKEFQYGSSDFFLLGLVVERVTPQTLAQFAEENLFKPLGMTRTYYEEDPGLSVKHRAVGHWKGDDGWSSQGQRSKDRWRLWQANAYVAGGGGVRTCIEDLYRWDQGFDNDVLPRGKYMDEFLREGTVLGNRFVVDADAYKKRMQSHEENEPAGQFRGLKRLQFTGGFWGTSTCMARFPEQQFTVICLSNSSEVAPFEKTRVISELFLSNEMEPIDTADASDEDVEFINVSDNALQALTGAFRRSADRPVWRTEFRDRELRLVDHLDATFVLKPLTKTRFKAVGDAPFYPSARFDFETDETGRATAMTLWSFENGFKEVFRFERVALVQPAAKDLLDYAGTYVSDELAATYRFKVERDHLWLRVNSRRWERLKPLTKDEFSPQSRDPHDQRFLRFTRDGNGKVDGFSIGFWRIRGVEFSRTQQLSQME